MKKLTYIITSVIASFAMVFALSSPAQAAFPIKVNNHIRSVANLSITDTKPATSGHIYSIKPGYAGTGLGVYASGTKDTWCYTGSYSNGRYLTRGAWNYLAYSSTAYTCQVFNL